MKLLMRCQHEIDVDVDKVASPVCWCGEKHVVRAFPDRAPKFVGHARGPLVESKYLGAQAVTLATTDAPALTLKPETQRPETPTDAQ